MQSGFGFKISKMSQDLHPLHDFDVLIAVICIWERNKTYINGYISINYVKHFLRFPHFIFHLTRILIICFGHGSILIIALMRLLISHYNLKVCTQIALLKQLIKWKCGWISQNLLFLIIFCLLYICLIVGLLDGWHEYLNTWHELISQMRLVAPSWLHLPFKHCTPNAFKNFKLSRKNYADFFISWVGVQRGVQKFFHCF